LWRMNRRRALAWDAWLGWAAFVFCFLFFCSCVFRFFFFSWIVFCSIGACFCKAEGLVFCCCDGVSGSGEPDLRGVGSVVSGTGVSVGNACGTFFCSGGCFCKADGGVCWCFGGMSGTGDPDLRGGRGLIVWGGVGSMIFSCTLAGMGCVALGVMAGACVGWEACENIVRSSTIASGSI